LLVRTGVSASRQDVAAQAIFTSFSTCRTDMHMRESSRERAVGRCADADVDADSAPRHKQPRTRNSLCVRVTPVLVRHIAISKFSCATGMPQTPCPRCGLSVCPVVRQTRSRRTGIAKGWLLGSPAAAVVVIYLLLDVAAVVDAATTRITPMPDGSPSGCDTVVCSQCQCVALSLSGASASRAGTRADSEGATGSPSHSVPPAVDLSVPRTKQPDSELDLYAEGGSASVLAVGHSASEPANQRAPAWIVGSSGYSSGSMTTSIYWCLPVSWVL
jgi:hypothetical protein